MRYAEADAAAAVPVPYCNRLFVRADNYEPVPGANRTRAYTVCT